MASLWTWGIDYQNQPLLDAWWTPGWTSQNDAYVQVPPNQFTAQGFPVGLTYVNITGSYFDTYANPVSGYLTFWPSTDLTFTSGSSYTYMPQRYAGFNQTLLGRNNLGDGKIYLWYGRLAVTLLATDNANMTPSSFTYHVIEHYFEGLQYDISVPSSLSAAGADIRSLIIPGSIRGNMDENDDRRKRHIRIPVVSTQYVVADITATITGLPANPSSYPVKFAFMSGSAEPGASDWVTGAWYTTTSPYIAQALVGPGGKVLATGTYKVWVQLSSPPQTPVISVGYVEIY